MFAGIAVTPAVFKMKKMSAKRCKIKWAKNRCLILFFYILDLNPSNKNSIFDT